MAKRNYMIRDPANLNLRFYSQYDETFILRKSYSLLLISDNIPEFKQFVAKSDDSDELVDDKFAEALRAEVHFAEFHQFEAFFALLVAGFQPLPHWLYLTTYSTSEFRTKVNALLKQDIATVTNGHTSSPADFIDTAIYDGFRPDDPEKVSAWKTNIDNIFWFVKRLAKKFLDSPEYNAYKHGLRIITGPSYFRLYPTGQPEKGFTHESEDSIRYLELETLDNQSVLVRESFQHFNPDESVNHIYFMSSVLETVRSVRLARIKRDKGARLNTFISLDRGDISKLSRGTKWSIAT